MTIGIETALVVALAFAVFSAVTAIGSSLVLGIGFERLRAGFETIKNQTGFFADHLHKLDKKVDSVEKQSAYMFESLHKLEEGQGEMVDQPVKEQNDDKELAAPALTISTKKMAEGKKARHFWDESAETPIRFH